MVHRDPARPRAALGIGMGVVIGIGIAAMAGDLTPPVGPVVQTMKTLDDVEPRTPIRNDPSFSQPIVIGASGSYYLAEDIYAIPGEHGIEITADDVTLDLRGFAVRGNVEVGSLDGVHIDSSADNVAVIHGVVRDCPQSGVYALGANGSRFEGLRVLNCNDFGIMGGDEALVTNCIVRNTSVGIQVTDGALIAGCAAFSNGTGIFVNAGLVHGCSAAANTTNILIPGATGYDNTP